VGFGSDKLNVGEDDKFGARDHVTRPYKVHALYPVVHTLPEGRMVVVAQGRAADAILDKEDGRHNGSIGVNLSIYVGPSC
jgi:hypothetical protein